MQEPVLVRSQDRSQCVPLRCAREPEPQRERERSGKCARSVVSEGSLFFWLFFGFFWFFFCRYFLTMLCLIFVTVFSRNYALINSIFFFFFPNFLSLHLCLVYLFSRLRANCGSCVCVCVCEREREREREREEEGVDNLLEWKRGKNVRWTIPVLQKENVLVFVFSRENCFLSFVPQEVFRRLRACFLSFLSLAIIVWR